MCGFKSKPRFFSISAETAEQQFFFLRLMKRKRKIPGIKTVKQKFSILQACRRTHKHTHSLGCSRFCAKQWSWAETGDWPLALSHMESPALTSDLPDLPQTKQQTNTYHRHATQQSWLAGGRSYDQASGMWSAVCRFCRVSSSGLTKTDTIVFDENAALA